MSNIESTQCGHCKSQGYDTDGKCARCGSPKEYAAKYTTKQALLAGSDHDVDKAYYNSRVAHWLKAHSLMNPTCLGSVILNMAQEAAKLDVESREYSRCPKCNGYVEDFDCPTCLLALSSCNNCSKLIREDDDTCQYCNEAQWADDEDEDWDEPHVELPNRDQLIREYNTSIGIEVEYPTLELFLTAKTNQL